MPISQTINPMVNVPSISDLVNFEANVDYTLNTGLQTRATEMNTFASQANSTAATINAQAIALNLNSTTDASTTSNAIGTGSKTFTVSASKSFLGGMFLSIADAAAPSTNSMFCQVTSYSGTTLVVNVISIIGSGTKTSWAISQSSLIAASTIYTQSNILGTVSQSSGVPTGAFIESGSNANGRYTKYADGTLVCTQSSGVTFANSSNLTFAWTYPVAFSVSPHVVANTATANLVVTKAITCVGVYSVGTTAASIGIFSLAQFVAGDVTGELVHAHAIGRWF